MAANSNPSVPSDSRGKKRSSTSIQQGADLLAEVIEREKAKALEEARREYAELDRRFADFRRASDMAVKTRHTALQRAQNEVNWFRDMYQHLHNIIRDSPAGRDLLEHTSTSSESVNSTSLPDLTVVLPELLTRYERSQRDLHALRKERDALKNTMESDIGRLNQKISALQADIATLTNSVSPESDETAVVDTRGSGPLRLKLKVAKQQDSEFQSALAEVHTSRASSVPPAASPRPSSSLPPHNSRNSVPVKVERAESVTSVRSTTSSRPRLSLTELRAMLAERMAGQAAAQTSMVTDNPEPLVSSASDPSVVSTHVADTTANEPPVPPMVDLRRYCVCDQLAYGEMIACDAPGCRQEWFHLACVGLSIAPEGAWQCLECSLSSGNHHLL